MTDRLTLANALADAKIDRAAAERIATEIFDAITGNVATKADLERLEQRVEAAVQRLDGRIDTLQTELKAEIALLEHRLLIRLGGPIVVLFGLLFAALRYLPPAQ